ncbi:MAG: hypothetical protein ACE5GE_12950 [Phycisphaerae bacterium]
MQKFFRKHMNKILTVSMALLLVVWLGGSALQEMLTPKFGAELIATCVDGDIRQADLTRMQGMTAILTRLGIPWQAPMPIAGVKPLSVYDWVLLSREARRLGFVASLTDAEEALNRSNLPRERVNAVANQLEIAPKQVYAAVAEYQNVMSAAQVVAEAALISEAEMRVAARDTNEKINVNLVALRADSFTQKDGTFTDAEIQAFFDKYREQEAGPGMTFGYFQQPRVKVDFVKVDVEKVEQALSLSPKTLERKAHRYWKENRNRDQAFLRPRPVPEPAQLPQPVPTAPSPSAPPVEDGNAQEQPADSPGQGGFSLAQGRAQAGGAQPTDAAVEPKPTAPSDATSGAAPTAQTPDAAGPADAAPPALPASQPALPKPPSPYFETWPEAKEAALQVIRTQEASKRAKKLIDYLIQRGLEPWFDMEVGTDNYKKRPAGVDGPDYLAGLIGDLPPEFRWPGAVTTGLTDWFSQSDAVRVPELGTTWLEIPGGSSVAFGNAAFLVQGLAQLQDDADQDRSLFCALYQPGSMALRDGTGNLYLYRIVGTQPARPPERLDEVRDRVIADLAKQRGYDEAKRWAEQLKDEALKSGLEAAVAASTALEEALGQALAVQKPAPFGRKPIQRPGVPSKTFIPSVGFVDESFTRTCFELGPADQGRQPVAVIEAPEMAAVAVVEFAKLEPLSRDGYVSARPGLRVRIQSDRASQVIGEWLNPELIKSRNRYEEASREG